MIIKICESCESEYNVAFNVNKKLINILKGGECVKHMSVSVSVNDNKGT